MNVNAKKPDPESIRMAMDQAWREHQHARDQTWRTIHMDVVLAIGLVTVQSQFKTIRFTACAAALVILVALFGLLITIHHRKYQIKKFTHIMNCEKKLGLLKENIIEKVETPQKIGITDILYPKKHNTVLFIAWIHIIIILFTIIFLWASIRGEINKEIDKALSNQSVYSYKIKYNSGQFG